jgi:hypothetical protein
MDRNDPLPSWRPGSTRDALEAFLAAAEEVPVVDRVAYFDNDGTLWCERPSYVQLDFFLDALRKHVTKTRRPASVPSSPLCSAVIRRRLRGSGWNASRSHSPVCSRA